MFFTNAPLAWAAFGHVLLRLTVLALAGGQTWTSGMTLPPERYLQHPPQYFPPSPTFPLVGELSAQEAMASSAENKPLVVLLNGTVRLQMSSKKPIKLVNNPEEGVLQIRTVRPG